MDKWEKLLLIGLSLTCIVLSLFMDARNKELKRVNAISDECTGLLVSMFDAWNETSTEKLQCVIYTKQLQDDMEQQRTQLIECKEQEMEFILIAKQTATLHEWSANKYDCTQFSNDLVISLRKRDYEARVVHGYWHYINGETCEGVDLTEFDCRHDWVCLGKPYDYSICIEATKGEIIPHDWYGTIYKFEGEGQW